MGLQMGLVYQTVEVCLVLIHPQGSSSQERERGRIQGQISDGGAYGVGAMAGGGALNENPAIGTGSPPTSLARLAIA